MIIWFTLSLRFHKNEETDDWDIFPTRDGDTLWNSKSDMDTVYVRDLFEKQREAVLKADEEKAKIQAQKVTVKTEPTKDADKASY